MIKRTLSITNHVFHSPSNDSIEISEDLSKLQKQSNDLDLVSQLLVHTANNIFASSTYFLITSFNVKINYPGTLIPQKKTIQQVIGIRDGRVTNRLQSKSLLCPQLSRSPLFYYICLLPYIIHGRSPYCSVSDYCYFWIVL